MEVGGRNDVINSVAESVISDQSPKPKAQSPLAVAELRWVRHLPPKERFLVNIMDRPEPQTARTRQKIDRQRQKNDQKSSKVDRQRQKVDRLSRFVDRLSRFVDRLFQFVDRLFRFVDRLIQFVDRLFRFLGCPGEISEKFPK